MWAKGTSLILGGCLCASPAPLVSSEVERGGSSSYTGHFAYCQGKWKLLLAKGSGGWTSPTEKEMPRGIPNTQLYDMEADPGETRPAAMFQNLKLCNVC